MWGNEESEKSVLQRLRRSSIILIATLAMAATFAQSASAIELPKYSLSFGSSGSGTGQFGGIPGIATDAEGAVFAVDYDHGRVEKFSPSGEYISQFGSTGSEAGQLLAPNGLAIDSSGIIYVTEYSNNRIQEFNSNGESIGFLGKQGPGKEDGQVQNPTDITIDPTGNFWVSEDHNQVQEFNSNGEFVRKFGSFGTGNGQFHIPSGVAVDGSGNVWVADLNNNRVQKFNSKGEFLLAVSSLGAGHGSFSHPTDLVVDPSDRIWVAEEGHVVALSDGGEYLGEFSPSEGSPSAVALDASGYFWVGSSVHHVEKWATPRTLNPDWRIEGSSLPELEAWEPYSSSGAFEVATEVGGQPLTIGCKESGSGTLGFQETMNLSECEAEYNGEECEVSPVAPLKLDGEFQSEFGSGALLMLFEIEECASPELIPVYESGGMTMKAGAEAVEFPASMSENTYVISETAEHEAEVSVSSTWTLTGKYEGEKFAYAEPESLNPDWRIEGSSLPELEAWEPYSSSGAFEVATEVGGQPLTIGCKESGSGTLGFQETMNLSECEAEYNGEECEVSPVAPLKLDGEFQSEFGSGALLMLFEIEECASPELIPVYESGGMTMKAGAEAVEFPASMSENTYVISETAEHEAEVSVSSTWTLTGKYEGEKFAYAEPESLNPDWRIEGSSLPELEAWEPYSSSGAFEVATEVGGQPLTIGCKESGSGTLGFQETMNLSECEAEYNGEECEVSPVAPLKLDGEFQSEFGSGALLMLFEIEECASPELIPVYESGGMTMKAGAEAVEFPASMSENTYVISETAEHEAEVSVSSTWTLTGKYEGEKFAYAEPESLNPDWRIEGSSLPELEAWEPYSSSGAFEVATEVGGQPLTIGCKESGSGTLGFQETMNLSECEAEYNGEECEVSPVAPLKLDGEFQSEFGSGALLMLFEIEECASPELIPVYESGGMTMKAGAEAVEFPASMSENTYVISETAEHEAEVSVSSTWTLTGKYEGSEFGYE